MISPYDNKPKSSKSHAQDAIPSFIRKTYDILDERKFPDVIDWNPEGNALVIKKPSEFCQKVLPLYFKHNNLTSFVRQLNMYNFHKRRTQNVDHVYYHELFQKGKKHLLKEIKRKNHEAPAEKYPHGMSTDNNESMQAGKEASGILCENQFLKRLYNDAMSKIAIFENQIQDLTNQNNSLRSQLFTNNPSNEQLNYKSVPASLEITQPTFQKENIPMGNGDIAIPPLKLKGQRASQFLSEDKTGAANATFFFNNDESTEPTNTEYSSPNLQQGVESDKSYDMSESTHLNSNFATSQMSTMPLNTQLSQTQVPKFDNTLKISRKETSMSKFFSSWPSQSFDLAGLDTSVLGKRDLNLEKNVSLGGQFDVPEPLSKRNELSLFGRKGMISNGIEDKELMKVFMQRGISNEDFGLDLMNFCN